MPSETDLCNDALGQLGEKPITAIDDGTAAANLCQAFLPALRDDALVEHHWNFNMKHIELALDDPAVKSDYIYSYALPADCLKVIQLNASDGSTVRKTVYTGTKDDVEVVVTTLTNRQYAVTSAAGNYTTLLGDYLVIEVGIFADPQATKTHGSSIRFGDSAGADLAEDDTTTTDNNPWFQLTDTVTFTCQRQFTLTGVGC